MTPAGYAIRKFADTRGGSYCRAASRCVDYRPADNAGSLERTACETGGDVSVHGVLRLASLVNAKA